MMFKVANKSLRVILALSLVFSNETFARSKQVTKEEERKLLQALAELAIEGQEPELQSPLAEASREMYLRQDLENILKSETKIIVEEQYHVKVAPNVTTINGANTKFLNLAKRVALEQSLSSLFFYSVISYQQNPFLSRLSFGSQEILSKQYTGALSVLKVWESNLSEARRYRDVLLNSSVDTIIKKGFEVGALAEHSDTLKGQLAEVDALLPETKDHERSDLLKKKEELTSQIFALDIEVDQRISQDPLFLSLTLPIIPANQSQPIPLYVYLREFHNQNLEIIKGVEGIQTTSNEFQELKNEIKILLSYHGRTFVDQTTRYIETVLNGGEEVLAPLTAVRLQTLEYTESLVTEFSNEGFFNKDQPMFEDFVLANETLEKKYGFDNGRYNGYTASDFFGVLATGFVAGEMIRYLALKSPKLVAFDTAVANAFENASKKIVTSAAERNILLRGGSKVLGWGVRWLGRIAGPIGWIGSSAMIAYDVKKGTDRKNYRLFLKTFIPQAFAAGAVGNRFNKFSQEVDDKIMDYLMIAEVITTVMLGNQMSRIIWAEKFVRTQKSAQAMVRSVTMWARWARVYKKAHYDILARMVTRSAVGLMNATTASSRALYKTIRSVTWKNIWRSAKTNANHIAFIGGSVATAFDSHFVAQGYGHVFYDVPLRAIRQSDDIFGFAESLGRQFKHAFLESPQAQMDVVSILLSDAVLSVGSVNPNLTPGQLGHLYGVVSAGAEVVGQVAIAFAKPGDQDLVTVIEKIEWQRALIHYAFVVTFSTWKHLALYIPIMNGMLRPLVRRMVQQPFLRTMVRATEIGVIKNRNLAAWAARTEKGSTMWMARFGLSLGSNWVGNNGFIQIAMALKKNSSDVPQAVVESTLNKVKAQFEEMGLEWNAENVQNKIEEAKQETLKLRNLRNSIVMDAINEVDTSITDAQQ